MKSKWIFLPVGIVVVLGVAFLYKIQTQNYFGLQPALQINKCTIPVSISGTLSEPKALASREDFVNFIKSSQTSLHTNSISAALSLDGFINDSEINWSSVLRATKIYTTLFGDSYVLQFKPKPQSCPWATLLIDSDGKYFSIYGCCGQIQPLKPGESRAGYGSFPNE